MPMTALAMELPRKRSNGQLSSCAPAHANTWMSEFSWRIEGFPLCLDALQQPKPTLEAIIHFCG
jgi:hypothetical protein